MSKAAKHAAKMSRKRADKAAKKAAYAALAGTSKKTKRSKNRKPGPTGQKHAHVMSDCGNPGCKRCYPRHQLLAS
jgi:hypothetical protein